MTDETMRLPAGTEPVRTIRMVRRFNAPPERVSRAWFDSDELARWFPDRVEGSLSVGARTVLVWEDHRVWWEVTESRVGEVFAFRWPWLPDDSLVTSVRVTFQRSGYGTLMELEDGPFPIDEPRVIDAWAAGLEGWGEALAMLRAYVDFSVDLRTRG
jgi:uncharacterized protein YndB with AHSA1/START domain